MFGIGPIELTIILTTSLWVLYDANKLAVGKGSVKPIGWFFLCIFLWLLAFPAYLITRPKYKAARAQDISNYPSGNITHAKNICGSCGKQSEVNSKYCPYCGKATTPQFANEKGFNELNEKQPAIKIGLMVFAALFVLFIILSASSTFISEESQAVQLGREYIKALNVSSDELLNVNARELSGGIYRINYSYDDDGFKASSSFLINVDNETVQMGNSWIDIKAF